MSILLPSHLYKQLSMCREQFSSPIHEAVSIAIQEIYNITLESKPYLWHLMTTSRSWKQSKHEFKHTLEDSQGASPSHT